MTNQHASLPVLDQAVVDELLAATGADEGFLRELIGTYVEEGAANVADLEAAAAAGDPATVVRPAHTLKSTSASVGAMRLSAICRDLEEAGREGEAEALAERVGLARSTWSETLEALRSAGLSA